MPTTNKSYLRKLFISLKNKLNKFITKNILTKLLSLLIFVIFIIVLFMYLIALWYIHSQQSKPFTFGVSYIPDYATSLGLDPQKTMDALIKINVKEFRLTSYWSDIEMSPNHFDFSQLDWEFRKAESAHAKIILTIGLRQPRWPECHAPKWVNLNSAENNWLPGLENYMKATINRYKLSPSLEDYQLENEYFLRGFGICTNFDRNRLINEYKLVKSQDQIHQIIIGRSNNAIGFPFGSPRPDKFSISVYKRVWDATATHRYLEYPYPAWYYAYLAGVQKILFNRDMIISEMQAEAWAPNNKSITQISLDEQNKSLNSKRLKDRFSYGKASGMRNVEMWGAEYWYYRLNILHDPSLWNEAKQEFKN